MRAEITYLDNSGFLVKTRQHTLVVDYYNNRPAGHGAGRDGGVIDIDRLTGDNIYVFVSHRHMDHYNPVIFKWEKHVRNIRYILSDDVPAHPGALMAAPNREYTLDDIRIETLRSTDEGVAFIVDVDGLCIYHAGDLNWWNWEGDDFEWNAQMAGDYRRQMDFIVGRKIDVAFVPVDPRLGGSMLLGIHLLMNMADVRCAIPMHYGANLQAVQQALAGPQLPAADKRKIAPPMRRGQTMEV